MIFNHIPIKTPIIESAHNDTGHYYSIDGQTYPSITTILHSFPNKGIEIWKSRTPNWREIQEESLKTGTSLHSMIEQYLNNTKHIPIKNIKSNELFQNLKPELDKINNIQCVEKYLYEPNLRVAGCTDCIADFDGVLSVCDFKNSRKPKKDYMFKQSGYYEQVTSYALMYKYCTGIKIDQGVILSANWDNSISVKKFNIDDYIDNLENILELYYESER